MKGIATILRETNVKQVEGTLAEFDGNNEIVGKCALGVISCEVGLTLKRFEKDPMWEEILLKAGVPVDFTRVGECFDSGTYHEDLQSHIIYLNDTLKLTFKEIADWIENTFPEDDWAK